MNKLIEFETRSEFESFITNNSGLPLEEALSSSNNGVYGSVVFIKDTGEIYANNKLQDSDSNTGGSQKPNYVTYEQLNSSLLTKQDKVQGKGLSTNDYTTADMNKLAGIAAGAEVNIQSDWSINNSNSDAYIKNKPTIPTASTVAAWGFTKTTGTYSKPSTGIPKSDLTSAVQTSLEKADSAIQGDDTIKSIVKVSSLPSNPDASTLYVVL